MSVLKQITFSTLLSIATERTLSVPKTLVFTASTGKTTSIRDFIIKAFNVLDIEIEFQGVGVNEIGIITKAPNKFNSTLKIGQIVVKVDKKYFRPTEVDLLIGDPQKAIKELNWKLNYDLDSLVKEMVESDFNLFSRD